MQQVVKILQMWIIFLPLHFSKTYFLPSYQLLFRLSRYMSQKPRQSKDGQNINSKLLGANLADINIEKFRDLSQYNKDKYELAGKFTIPLLKTITNKFSPVVMFTIVLPSQAISNI